MAKPTFAIVLPCVRVGVGNLLDVCEGKQRPEVWGIFTFDKPRRAVAGPAQDQPTYQEAVSVASKMAQEVITSIEVFPVADFWAIHLINQHGESIWFDDRWTRDEAVEQAAAYGLPVHIREGRSQIAA
ncbi:hypothetical protein [Geoalkalibacter subterraneus]|nr:hypothetical protein [Geoalkalibacter subterraneus]